MRLSRGNIRPGNRPRSRGRAGTSGGLAMLCEATVMDGALAITLPGEEPVAARLVLAIRAGDAGAVGGMLGEEPRLARARLAERAPPRRRFMSSRTGPATFQAAAGQRRVAEYLLARGADLAWVPDYAQGTPLDATAGLGTRQENVITWLREMGAPSAGHAD